MENVNFDIIDNNLSLSDVYNFVKSDQKIFLSEKATTQINNSRFYLEDKLQNKDELIYGVNTGFGSLCTERIGFDEIEKLQENLVNSHNAGSGKFIPNFINKLILFLKIRSLSFGYSGVRLELVERLILFYNHNCIPNIREQGSLGASGDLAPLAVIADMLISHSHNKRIGKQALNLSFKEGLALLNGTQFMSAYGLFCLVESQKLYHFANLIASISLEAFLCKSDSFHALVSSVRNHYGQKYTSQEILHILDGSESFFTNEKYVQDPYSFRCIPQVHGASLDVIRHVESVFQIEIDSVTDNPLIFHRENKILSAGNFHGQPLALAMDYLALAVSEIGSISERRTFKLISGERNLPPYLTSNPGLESGFMITQYTAASIVNQNKLYSTPCSIDSIVSSNGQEDHVSMGANSGVKLYKIVDNLKTILSIELLNSIYALHLQKRCNGKSSPLINQFLKELNKKGIYFTGNTDLIPPTNRVDQIRNFINSFDILGFLKISQ